MNKQYKGIIIPAVTPLTTQHELDEPAVERMMQRFNAAGAAAFVAGTTGEGASLSTELKLQYVRKAASLKGETLLYAGVGGNKFQKIINEAKALLDAGADCLAITLPSYYQLTVSDMRNYFQKLAVQIPGPIIIYNIPATTHMSIPLELVEELSATRNIVGLKDSERDEARMNKALELFNPRYDFSYFIGWAAQSAHVLLQGGDGIIPSTGNINPYIYTKMLHAANSGNAAIAQHFQEHSDKLGALYQSNRTLGQSLWALKTMMRAEQICEAYMMPPLQEGSADETLDIIESYQNYKQQYESDLQPA